MEPKTINIFTSRTIILACILLALLFAADSAQSKVITDKMVSQSLEGNLLNNPSTINIKNRLFDDFTVETRINQATGDAGAHLYFRNDAQPGNNGKGYWFGFVTSGWQGNPIALRDTVHFWKMFANNPNNIQELLNIPLKLPGDQWLRLKVETGREHARMWYQREDIDDNYILTLETNALVEFKRGNLGFWCGGEKVWVDYVLVYDAEGPTQRPVQPAGKLTLRWAEVKIPLR